MFIKKKKLAGCFVPEVGPASMIVGNLVAGKRIAQASGRDVAQLEDNDQARKVDVSSSSHPLIATTQTLQAQVRIMR